jgi:hypothetical protein
MLVGEIINDGEQSKKVIMKFAPVFLSAFVSMLALSFSGCMKEIPVMGIPKTYPYTTLATVKKLYQGSDLPLIESNTKGTSKFTGIVISDAANKNMPAGVLVVQSDTAGIAISMNAGADSYQLGDSLEITFSSGTMGNFKGRLQITGLTTENIKKVGSGKTVEPVQLTIGTLAGNFARYEATLVKIAGADLVPVPATGETYSGDKDLYDASAPAGTVKLHTEANAGFAANQALPNATFTGIPLRYNASANTVEGAIKQLWLRNATDIENNSIPLHADVIITGFLSDPRGADGPVAGTVSGIVTHAGGYEYVQLMALRDIDFAATPYAVVIANNGTATVNGWANGSALTFKFNLSSGFAAKGTFFYVGGPSKVIGGYTASVGKSTDISSSNWIRTINYNVNNTAVVVGDGFGNSNAGLMGNSSPADGIAVFNDTVVTAASVPIDAVFYGATVGTAYSGGNGYRIPANDHYNPVHPVTGDPQPFFGQGTNTYVFAQPASDKSSFSKLGGVLSANAWIIPRETTLAELLLTARITEIESAVGVTFFRQ